jgi:membrane protein DedA with SNARE-associated domain
VIKYLAAARNMEIAFAPVLGTRMLVPFRLVIPTPLGIAMLEATQFITAAAPPRVAKTN